MNYTTLCGQFLITVGLITVAFSHYRVHLNNMGFFYFSKTDHDFEKLKADLYSGRAKECSEKKSAQKKGVDKVKVKKVRFVENDPPILRF